jgi:uncharacterized protein (TIGR02466 family)
MNANVNMNISPSWSTPLGRCTYPRFRELNPRLARLLKEKMAQGDRHKNKKAWPNKGGQQWESEFDLFTQPEPELKELSAFCDQAVRFMIRATAVEPVPPDNDIATVYESWFHITGYGGYQSTHDHGSCVWCGVYYVQAGDVDRAKHPYSGYTKFYDPRRSANSLYDGRYDPGLMLERPMYFEPQDGMLLLFPNYILHEQTPYFGQAERIVVAFNCRVLTTMIQPHAEAASMPATLKTLNP